ncbi:uncharacterized protein LOC124407153 [Diprion similis]|uniref:uncharacterized protein LOC124407153 n=1 Tax=Diprion similis TaxID=362088 RepID=UPI001EF8AA2A|nr:uncharacterized protein LOC124407153 [Diprion similis]
MRPDSRSISFTFHRSALTANNISDEPKESRNLRQRLQDRFDQECPYNLAKKESPSKKRTSKCKAGTLTPEKGWSNLSLSNVSADSRRAFRNGAEKLSKTISSVRMTFGTISQKFRSSTRRRQRLEECHSPTISATPQTRSRHLLGRTPTKLYSPFGIESPRSAWSNSPGKENYDSSTRHKLTSVEEKLRKPFQLTKANGFTTFR